MFLVEVHSYFLHLSPLPRLVAKNAGDAIDGFINPHVVGYANYSHPMWYSVHSVLSCINAQRATTDDSNSVVKPTPFEGGDDLKVFFPMETNNVGLVLYSP